MELTHIDDKTPFPDVRLSSPEGLLAYGGSVAVDRLLEAYPLGIFPWYNAPEPVLWWAPQERCVLYPALMHCSKSLKKTIRSNRFELRIDTAFDRVVQACSHVGENRKEGSWLNFELKSSLSQLHSMGLAHSFESWRDGKLVGGLYGMSIGGMFFGESMFAAEADASKVAFYHLSQWMHHHEMDLIDCQIPNDHLLSLGAEVIPGDIFYPLLSQSVRRETIEGPWQPISRSLVNS